MWAKFEAKAWKDAKAFREKVRIHVSTHKFIALKFKLLQFRI